MKVIGEKGVRITPDAGEGGGDGAVGLGRAVIESVSRERSAGPNGDGGGAPRFQIADLRSQNQERLPLKQIGHWTSQVSDLNNLRSEILSLRSFQVHLRSHLRELPNSRPRNFTVAILASGYLVQNKLAKDATFTP